MEVKAMSAAGEGLDILRRSAGVAPVTDVGWIAVTGSDRVRWLNGMVSNSVQSLKVGEGAYTFLLNAQGRIQGDATVWCSSDDLLLLETDLSQLQSVTELLERFIIMDDVELEPLPRVWQGLRLAGLEAPAALRQLDLPAETGTLAKHSGVLWRGYTLTVVAAFSPVVPQFEIWSRDEGAIQAVSTALGQAGVQPVPPESFELLRVLGAVPRFGVDIRDKDLPQETAQTRALHFNKGCYLGQEIVERIRSRGQVHRTFSQFELNGEIPVPGAELVAEGKPVGVLTTVAAEPIDGVQLALGYVRREAVERKLPILYAGGTATPRVEAPSGNTASNA